MSVCPVPSHPDHNDHHDHHDRGDHEEVGSDMRKLKVVHEKFGGCLISYNLQIACVRKLEVIKTELITMNEWISNVGRKLFRQIKSIRRKMEECWSLVPLVTHCPRSGSRSLWRPITSTVTDAVSSLVRLLCKMYVLSSFARDTPWHPLQDVHLARLWNLHEPSVKSPVLGIVGDKKWSLFLD